MGWVSDVPLMGHLDQRLVAHPLSGVAVVDRITRPVDAPEHRPIRPVRVVGDRERLDALGAQRVHPVPQPFRILGVEPREGQLRQRVGVPEDHVAMKVAPVIGS
jgi:hypothetical protein